MSSTKLILESKEGETFLVDPQISNMINLIKDMTEDNANSDEKLPFDQISSSTLKLIINFCE